eukprot:TRINITY_DN3461_c0_g2_i1.p1 TRINITY_DN3461_c0_g2~~TRINITY_DN3461_c0_g2_i1.p1  ORF type:complete len:897 (-),score=197.99 TRINITY_DN3461_c0_g2_i1:267-2957(-)
MWINPIETTAKTTFWEVLKENQFFQLLKHKASSLLFFGMITPQHYRIVLRNKNNEAVAVADTLDEIDVHWHWLESNLLYAFRKNVAASDYEGVIEFFKLTIEGLAKKSLSEQEEKLSLSLSNSFAQLFNLPTEKLFTSYYSSLWKRIHWQGTLYISENYLCFSCGLIEQKIKILFKEITSLNKTWTHFFDNSITITTINNQEYVFIFFNLKRDECYSTLQHLWKIALDRMLRVAESSLDNQTPSQKKRASQFYPPIEDNNPQKSYLPSRIIQRWTAEDKFEQAFRLPKTEKLICDYESQFIFNYWPVNGTIYLSHNFICFQTAKDEKSACFKIVLPLIIIKSIAQLKEDLVKISTKVSQKFYFSLGERRNEIHRIISEVWKLLASEELPTTNEAPACSDGIRPLLPSSSSSSPSSPPSPSLLIVRNQVKTAWSKYFAKYGRSVVLIQSSPRLKNLVRCGIPDDLRAELWQYLSGSRHKSITSKKTYEMYLRHAEEACRMGTTTRRADEEQKSSGEGEGEGEKMATKSGNQRFVVGEIERDLARTLPEHPFYHSEEGLLSLKNVLLAFSLSNPEIGYCQSMNILVALFLLYLSEENAFWLLSSLCEDLRPDNYYRHMIGTLVDQTILERLLKDHLPDLSDHLIKCQVPLNVISQSWFYCFFLNYVPLETGLRIIDCFFFEGSNILFAVGIALFLHHAPTIMTMSQADEIVPLFKAPLPEQHTTDLMNAAFDFMDLLSEDKIQETRYQSKFKTIQEMEFTTKSSCLRKLQNKTEFNEAELETVYDRFQLELENQACSDLLQEDTFKSFFLTFVPQWKDRQDLIKPFFKECCLSNRFDFDKFVSVIGLLQKGSLHKQFRCLSFMRIFLYFVFFNPTVTDKCYFLSHSLLPTTPINRRLS